MIFPPWLLLRVVILACVPPSTTKVFIALPSWAQYLSMSARRQDKTTLLPQALRDRIEEQGSTEFFAPLACNSKVWLLGGTSKTAAASKHSHNSYGRPAKKGLSRRALREEERNAKKRRKAEYFAHRPSFNVETLPAKRKAEVQENERPVKKRKIDPSAISVSKGVHAAIKDTGLEISPSIGKREPKEYLPSLPRKKEKTHSKPTVASYPEKHVKAPPIPRFETDEDKEIEWLEYQLGIGSKKKKPGRGSTSYAKLLKEDGLDGTCS